MLNLVMHSGRRDDKPETEKYYLSNTEKYYLVTWEKGDLSDEIEKAMDVLTKLIIREVEKRKSA